MKQSDELRYGCSVEDLDRTMSRFENVGEFNMFAMSILSDSQEELVRGNVEAACQFINRAKYVMGQYHSRLRDVSVRSLDN